MRENSEAISCHQVSTCAGWVQRPTAAEFYNAIHAEEQTERERGILRQWVQETHWEIIFQAWVEDVYTMRELVAALHRAGLTTSRWSRRLNKWATIPYDCEKC